jgi:hypothetical protein
LWINATTLKYRFDAASGLTFLTGIPINGAGLRLDTLNYLDNLSNPNNLDTIIDDTADVFTPKGLTALQKLILKTTVDPTNDWPMEYSNYLTDPATYGDAIRNRIDTLLREVFKLPEFHVM